MAKAKPKSKKLSRATGVTIAEALTALQNAVLDSEDKRATLKATRAIALNAENDYEASLEIVISAQQVFDEAVAAFLNNNESLRG